MLAGAVIGATTRRIVPAFLLGVASHFALDAAPHWGPRSLTLMQVAVPDGLAGLVVMGAMTAVAPRGRRAAVLAGMAGAALPDLDKPSKVFFGRSPFPRAVDRLHMVIQDEAPHRFKYEMAAAVAFCAAAVGLLRAPAAGARGRSPSRPGPDAQAFPVSR